MNDYLENSENREPGGFRNPDSFGSPGRFDNPDSPMKYDAAPNSPGSSSGFNSPGGFSGFNSPDGFNSPGTPDSTPDSHGETVQLLRELLETQKRSLRTARLALGLCMVVLAAVALMAPAAVRTVRRVNTSIEQVASMARTVETAAGGAGKAAERIGDMLAGFDGGALSGLTDALSGAGVSGETLAESVRSFQQGIEDFRSVMDKLNGIDFEGLNQAVQDLSSVAAPFRQFSGLFGG